MRAAASWFSWTDSLRRFVRTSSLARGRAASPVWHEASPTNSCGSWKPHLGRYLDIQRDAFRALNTAFIEDGAFVHVARGATLRRADPSAVCFHDAADAPRMSHPRNLIVAEQDSARRPSSKNTFRWAAARRSATPPRNWLPATTRIVSHYMIEREDTQTPSTSPLCAFSRAEAPTLPRIRCCSAAGWCATTSIRCSRARAASA